MGKITSLLLITVCFSLYLSIHETSADQVFAPPAGGGLDRSSREPKYKIEFHSEDSPYNPDDEQEAVFMPNTNGKNYLCFLPKAEKPKSGKLATQHNTSSMIMESEKRVKVKTPDELLEVMDEHCFLRQETWWTYEYCHKKHLRQFHLEDDKAVQEFFLGYYDPEATAAYNQNLSDVSILKDPRSKDASHRYHSHQFTNGTTCDLTNLPRETEVRFVCAEGRTMINSITELSTCKYALTVQSQILCAHPLFQEERPVWHAIHCNLLRDDAEVIKAEEDNQHGKQIKMVRDIEYPFNIDADDNAV